MPQRAYAIDVSIDDDEYTIPTNQVEIVLDLIHSEFEEQGGFITYQSIDGLNLDESDVPQKYHDREFLVCDPVVYREDGDVVVAGNTDFHGMGNSIALRIPESAVELKSNVNEESWIRNQHKFEDHLTKNEVLDPTLDILPIEESNEPDILDKLEKFVEHREDYGFSVPEQQIEGTGDMSGSWVQYEADALQFYQDNLSVVIEDPTPENLVVTDDPYQYKESVGLPDAFEGHQSFYDTPVLVYRGEDTVAVLG